MEEIKRDIIHIGEQDEIIDIIDKIKRIPDKTVTLVIPKGSVILQDVTNLKILQKKSEELGKEISVSKADITDFYQKENIFPKPQMQEPKMENVMPAFAEHPAQAKRMSDIVKRGETVDLRKANQNKPERTDEQLPVADKKETGSMPFSSEREVVYAFPQEKRETSRFTSNEDKEDKKDIDNLFAENLDNGKEASPKREGVRRINREELFDDESHSTPNRENEKKFDFSYGYNKKKKKRSSMLPTISSRVFAIFILICIITASFSLFFLLPKASIAVTLKKEKVKGNYAFVLDKSIQEIDASADKIPSQTNDVTSEKTQTFTATGKKQLTTKASGEITIFNECSTGEQTLVAGTRFLSKDGKVFKIENSTIVPGFTKPEDATIPGAKTVKIVAEEAGEAYNINATSFTIPKLQELGSWKYSCLYARSTNPMAGGSNKEVTFISQDDYDKAKEALTKTVQEENTTKIAQQKDDKLIYIDDKNSEGDASVKSPAKVDDVADQFEMTVSVKKSVLTAKKADLEDLLKKKIKAGDNSENAKAVDGSLTYEIGDAAEKDGQLFLNVSAEESFIFGLDMDKTKKEIIGKNKQELTDYFTKINGVKSVSVNLWPFWVNKVPNSFDKINITLDISDSV